MREGNDVAGLLFGDHASLWITKLFVDLRLSPSLASVGFLVAGLAGAGLQALDGGWALTGALCLVLYYVLDCVDGEVARWQRVVALRWGYFDYIFHLLIKPLVFLGVGLGVVASTGRPMLLLASFSAAVATLWLKIFREIPGILFLREVLGSGREEEAAAEAAAAAEPGAPAGFRLGLDLVTLRAAMTNFDIGLLFLTAACAADLLLPGGPGAGLSWRAAWLLYYGILLPLDFADHLRTDLSRDRFGSRLAGYLALTRGKSRREEPSQLETVGTAPGGVSEGRRRAR